MDWLERTIATVSPRWAAERAYFHAVLEQSRMYNSAKQGRRGEGWSAGGKSANAEIGQSLTILRNRARQLVRDNPYAAGYPRMMASKIIGTGIQPRLAMTGDDNKEARARARGIWDRFADNCDPERQSDYYGLQSLACSTACESGEALIRTVRLPSRLRAPFPLQIVVQEADYIDTAKTQALENGNIIIQGVEYDTWGRRVAYWLFPEHPGESIIRFTRRTLKSERVEATDIDHIFERLRPGQVRGVPMFAAVAMKMRDIDDYDDAELMRRKIASCFVAFRRPPQGMAASPLTGKSTTDSSDRTVEKLGPGMIKQLGPGEDVTFGNPPEVNGYTDYLFGQLYAVSAGLGCTFEQFTGNLKGVNLSSIRVGENKFRDLRDHWQWNIYIPQMCKRTWDRVGQVARITGELSISDPWTPRWIPPAWRSPDPMTDIQATKEAVRNLQISPFDAISLAGYDPEEVLEETAQFNKAVDALGIVTDMDPRKVGLASAAKPADAGGNKSKTDDTGDAQAA